MSAPVKKIWHDYLRKQRVSLATKIKGYSLTKRRNSIVQEILSLEHPSGRKITNIESYKQKLISKRMIESEVSNDAFVAMFTSTSSGSSASSGDVVNGKKTIDDGDNELLDTEKQQDEMRTKNRLSYVDAAKEAHYQLAVLFDEEIAKQLSY
jgi:hypothetical protein